jgi:heat shock transcription factor
MPSHANPRKRSAPESTPATQSQTTFASSNLKPFIGDQFLNWGSTMTGAGDMSFPDAGSTYGNDMFGAGLETRNLNEPAQPQPPPTTSTQLTRRSAGQQQVVPRGGALQDEDDAWLDFTENLQIELRQETDLRDDDEALEQRAQVAKREALAKRKQIPPFVQKLSR